MSVIGFRVKDTSNSISDGSIASGMSNLVGLDIWFVFTGFWTNPGGPFGVEFLTLFAAILLLSVIFHLFFTFVKGRSRSRKAEQTAFAIAEPLTRSRGTSSLYSAFAELCRVRGGSRCWPPHSREHWRDRDALVSFDLRVRGVSHPWSRRVKVSQWTVLISQTRKLTYFPP